MELARKLAGWEDLLRMPEDVRAEVVDGQLVTPPSPLPRHARAQRALSHFVGGPYDDDDGHGGPARSGVPYFWLVDPDARTLEALRLDSITGAWIEVGAYDDTALERIAPFEGIELAVGRLFPPAQP